MDVKVKFEHPTMTTHEVYAELLVNTKLFGQTYKGIKFIHMPNDPDAFVIKMEDQLTAEQVYQKHRNAMYNLYSNPKLFVTNDLDKYEKICYEHFHDMTITESKLYSKNIYGETSSLKYDPNVNRDESQQFLDIHNNIKKEDSRYGKCPNILKKINYIHSLSLPVSEKILMMIRIYIVSNELNLEIYEKLLSIDKLD